MRLCVFRPVNCPKGKRVKNKVKFFSSFRTNQGKYGIHCLKNLERTLANGKREARPSRMEVCFENFLISYFLTVMAASIYFFLIGFDLSNLLLSFFFFIVVRRFCLFCCGNRTTILVLWVFQFISSTAAPRLLKFTSVKKSNDLCGSLTLDTENTSLLLSHVLAIAEGEIRVTLCFFWFFLGIWFWWLDNCPWVYRNN